MVAPEPTFSLGNHLSQRRYVILVVNEIQRLFRSPREYVVSVHMVFAVVRDVWTLVPEDNAHAVHADVISVLVRLHQRVRAIGEELNTLFYFNSDRTPAERLAFQEYAAIARLKVKKICCADKLDIHVLPKNRLVGLYVVGEEVGSVLTA